VGLRRDPGLYRVRLQATEGDEGVPIMSTPNDNLDEKQQEGSRRKDAAHALLEAHRGVYIRRVRRALLLCLLESGTATADDLAERIGPAPEGIDPRFLGTVPGLLARSGIIKRAGFTPSARPNRNASIMSVWELADRPGAITWLARNPELPDPLNKAGAPSPTTSKPPSPAPLAVSLSQATLF
jgi:hypothetical protein